MKPRVKQILTVMFLFLLPLGGCTRESTQTKYQKINDKEAKAIIDKEEKVVILDVRTEAEYDAGHIEHAMLIPDTELKDRVEEMIPDKETKILVYCRTGRRSAAAARVLIDMGYTDVLDFGGIYDWSYDIVTDKPQ